MTTDRQYLVKALDSFPRKIVVISPEFKILAVSGNIIQDNNTNFIGSQCYEVFSKRSEPCEDCPVKQVILTRKPSIKEKDCYFHFTNSPLCLFSYPIFSGDNIEAFVIMDLDIIAVDMLENELKRTNAFLRNLILSSVNAVISSDMKGNILIFNHAAAEITGYTKKEAIGKLNIASLYPENIAKQVMARLRSDQYSEKGKLKSYNVELKNKNGEPIPVNLNAAIVYEGGKEVATIGFFHDMREDIRIKKELENTQIQLLQSEKMASLGKLSAGVAHQLNNPLGGITLFTNLIMEDYELEPKLVDDLRRILKDAQRCRDTVRELLEFSRQTNYLKQACDVNQAISRTLFLLQNQTLFHNIEIIRNLSESLPSLYADIQQLNHMFMNIILNAAQAMESKGKLTMKTKLSLNKQDIIIQISDTGPGISDNIIKHIFDPFFTTKEQGKGTGLGLSLVYGIVENHGGSIKAENNPNTGATFTINLPLVNNNQGGNTIGK